MPLTAQQIRTLQSSIGSYNFPAVYYDFRNGRAILCISMTAVEIAIKVLLLSSNLTDVKNGLSNIIYWGYANSGYRDYRVSTFRNKITNTQINSFKTLVAASPVPSLDSLKLLGMPQFSGISFLSKITMFLNPSTNCVLDLQIAKLKSNPGPRALDNLAVNKTSIPANNYNNRLYSQWCTECSLASGRYYKMIYRAVDIERGLFHLIQTNFLAQAQSIYHNL